jgi:predicted transcriptional regulator
MSQKRLGHSKKNVIYLSPTHDRDRETQRRVLDALALKRRQPALSMTEAARRSGTTVKTVRRYAEPALETRSGRLDARDSDKIARDLRFLTDRGYVTIRVTNSRDATRVARHGNAVRKFALYGDDSALKRFEGKSLKAGGKTYQFITDRATINRLARAGELHFLDIYGPPGSAI